MFCYSAVIFTKHNASHLYVFTDSLYPGMTEYCEGDSFRAQCGVNENIIMQQAVYGRMMIGKCITKPLGEMNCQVNAQNFIPISLPQIRKFKICNPRFEQNVVHLHIITEIHSLWWKM